MVTRAESLDAVSDPTPGAGDWEERQGKVLGKCGRCQVRWVWRRRFGTLEAAHCPLCPSREPLVLTQWAVAHSGVGYRLVHDEVVASMVAPCDRPGCAERLRRAAEAAQKRKQEAKARKARACPGSGQAVRHRSGPGMWQGVCHVCGEVNMPITKSGKLVQHGASATTWTTGGRRYHGGPLVCPASGYLRPVRLGGSDYLLIGRHRCPLCGEAVFPDPQDSYSREQRGVVPGPPTEAYVLPEHLMIAPEHQCPGTVDHTDTIITQGGTVVWCGSCLTYQPLVGGDVLTHRPGDTGPALPELPAIWLGQFLAAGRFLRSVPA